MQDQLRMLIRQARELAGGLDAETFNRRPRPESWSVGECLDHLNTSARLYLPVFESAIRDARERGLTGHRGRGRTLLGRIVVWSMEPPARFRSKTYQQLEPSHDLDPARVLDEFAALHEKLVLRINEAADLDWQKIRIRSVLDPRLKMSLGDWFEFMAAHARRHLWQAERALEAVRDGKGLPPS